ncbi:hypothetical protein BD311DRAFT_770829 [Dichomitus squalens]|uniref:Phosphatidylglycerol/phosphatidylinositol transfer protein n=1 Tax=Dichomitus squalens TaxID=114155 RepID=A0A4Q9M970_9APHY|nr:hypothetical protein BD311DRAFT_770829 [Dichomitus squalens]
MRLSAFTTIFAALLSALPMARPAAVERRQVIYYWAGDSFQFLYKDSNFCESDVVTVAVYLSQTPPANSDVMANGRLADGTFEYYFGDYTISNFGLPPSSDAPPASLTMPVRLAQRRFDTSRHACHTVRVPPLHCDFGVSAGIKLSYRLCGTIHAAYPSFFLNAEGGESSEGPRKLT